MAPRTLYTAYILYFIVIQNLILTKVILLFFPYMEYICDRYLKKYMLSIDDDIYLSYT